MASPLRTVVRAVNGGGLSRLLERSGKPRAFDAFLTSSRNSLLGNSRLRSVLGFAVDFLSFRLSKCRETWKKMRWHICATFRAKVATSCPSEKEELACKNTRSVATTLYVPIRVSVADSPPAFHAGYTYCCRRVSMSADFLPTSALFSRIQPTSSQLVPTIGYFRRLGADLNGR
jgi:hypothetical protein